MTIKQFIDILTQIFKNWYVLSTLLAMLVIIGFSNFIVKYKRKPKKAKKKGVIADKPKPVEAPAEENADMALENE